MRRDDHLTPFQIGQTAFLLGLKRYEVPSRFLPHERNEWLMGHETERLDALDIQREWH